jgi:outer membrane protein TolC
MQGTAAARDAGRQLKRLLATVWLATWTAAALGQAQGGLSVSDAVRIALHEHPSLAVARGRESESAGRVRQTLGQKGPQIDLSSAYTRYDALPPSKGNIIGGGSGDIYSEVAVSQVLTTFGRVEGTIDAARALQAAEREGLRRTAQQVTYQVRRAYYALDNAGRSVAY